VLFIGCNPEAGKISVFERTIDRPMGLALHAVIGVSAPRNIRTFEDLPLQARLDSASMKPRCGIQIVDLGTGDVAHWLTIEGIVTELYDVAVLPERRKPTIVGFKCNEIRRIISMDGGV
jgi:uncharacterized protein (TIGR03032 family)